MKTINLLAQKILAGAVALAMFATVTTASAASVPQVITIFKVEGQARYSTDNKTWHALKHGDVLQPGSVIQTAENSTVDIEMGDHASTQQTIAPAPPISLSGINTAARPPATSAGGSGKANLIHIFPSSVLAIDKLVVDKAGEEEVAETQLDLRAGKILGNVKKLSASSRYEVKIPNGVAGIRGTVYLVSATGNVYVLEGQVIISYVNAQGQLVTATVTAGNHFNPFEGPNGTTTRTPPAENAILLFIVDILTRDASTPSITFVANNGTQIHVSPD